MRVFMLSLILLLTITAIGFAQGEEPLSLSDCVQIALKGNSTIIRELNNNQSADAGVTQSWSGILPTIDLNAALGRTTIGEQDREGNFQRRAVDPATGDVKYHDAMEAKVLGLSMIDIGVTPWSTSMFATAVLLLPSISPSTRCPLLPLPVYA